MGVATCAQIISEALLLAGDTSPTERAVTWLNQWLRSQYIAWPWPFLKARASGLSLPAGTYTYSVGGGSGTVTNLIQRIYDPIYLYTSGGSNKSSVRFRQITGGPIQLDESARSTSQTGMPTTVKGNPSNTSWGTFTLVFDPIPNQDYLFAFDYTLQPADIATGSTGGSGVPIYPNDQTIIHAVAAKCLLWMADERAPMMVQMAADMAITDRMKYGEVVGFNDDWQLAGDIFR